MPKPNDPHLDIHPAVAVEVRGVTVPIDVEMADMVVMVNELYPSIQTFSSCQGGCGSACREEAFIGFTCSDPNDLAEMMKQFEFWGKFEYSTETYTLLLDPKDLILLNDRWFPESEFRKPSAPRVPPPPPKPFEKLKNRAMGAGLPLFVLYAFVATIWLSVKLAWGLFAST